jgi:hypothetical protein
MIGCCMELSRGTNRVRLAGLLAMLVLFVAVFPLSPGRAAAADTGSVYVHLHPCPARTDGALPSDYGTLMSMCTEGAVYFNFSLTTEGATSGGQETGDPLERTWENVPMHIFTIEGQVTSYDDEPVVYCQNGNGETSNQYDQMVVSPANSWAIHPTLGASGYVVCDWFAASHDSGEATGSVTMDVHLCPESFDLVSADPNQIPTACPGAEPGVQFELASYNNPAVDQGTGDVVPTGVYWQYLNADFLQITQLTTDGFGTPRVFCRGVVDGGSTFDTAEIPANGGTFAYNLLAGEQLTCDWYMVLFEQGSGQQEAQPNQPSEQSEDAQQDQPSHQSEDFQSVQPGQSGEPNQQSNGGSVTVTVNERLCPQGYEVRYMDAEALANECTASKNGVLFVLVDSAYQPYAQATGAIDRSAVTWEGIGPGQILVTEPLPGGVAGQHAAFCSVAPQGASDSSDVEKMRIVNGTIHANVNGGEAMSCTWYDVS